MGEESLEQRVDRLVADGFAGVVRLDVARPHRPAGRLRAGRPRARAADDAGDPAGDGERLEDPHRARRAVAGRGRGPGAGRPRPHLARRRPAPGRRRRHHRAPAQPPVRDRRLPRRGRRRRPGRLPAAGLGPRARRHRGLPAAARGPPAEVRGRLAPSPTATTASSSWPSSPSGRRARRSTTSSNERVCAPAGSGPRLPPVGRPARRRGARLRLGRRRVRAPTSSTSRCAAAATAARSRPSTTCTTSGRPCWAGASCPTRRCGTCCAPGRTPTRAAPPTGSASGSTPRDGSLQLVGEDAGVSFTTVHFPQEQVTWTVLANTAGGAWPVHRAVAEHVGRPPSHT